MKNVRNILILYGVFLALLLVVTFVFSRGQREFFSAGENQNVVAYLGSSPLLNFLKWDSLWYLAIAQKGYFSPESHAFAAPLFPLLIKLFYFIIHNWIFSTLVINLILLPVTLYSFFRLLHLDYSEEFSYLVILIFLSFPFSFFLPLPFTEALFLFLTFSAFYSARKSRWGLSLVFAFIAAAARYLGLIVLFSVLIEYWSDHRNKNHRGRYETLFFLIGFIVSFLFLFIVWQRLGFFDPLILLLIRHQWQVTFLPFPFSFLNALAVFLRFPFTFPSYLFFYSLFFVTITMVSFRRLRPSYFFYLLISLVISLSKQDFGLLPASGSLGRYLLTLFPVFIVLTKILLRKKLLPIYLVVSIILLVFNFLLFLSNNFVG